MADKDVVTIDRNELYKEVWSTPGVKLAKKYGISDVALAKARKRHGIPRPPRGHWAKIAHGKASPTIPLPPASGSGLQQVRLSTGDVRARAVVAPTSASLAGGSARAVVTTVPARLSAPHPLIASTQRQLGDVDSGEKTGQQRIPTLSVSVSRGALSRALRIMNTLIKAWEAVGGVVAVDRHAHRAPKYATHFAVREDRVAVELEEKQRRVPAKSGWGHDRQYTGQLVLRIEHSWGANLRCTWADGKRQRLEELIDSILTGLLRRIDFEKQQRLDREIAGQQISRAKQRRAAAERNAAEEQGRREHLMANVDRWHDAERVRHYLSVLDTEVGLGKLKPPDEVAFRRWFEWANWYADHIDPLVHAEPLRACDEAPVNTPLDKLKWTRQTQPTIERLAARDTDELYKLRVDEISAAEGTGRRCAWDEVCRVLEGLGYDMAGRRFWL